MYDYFTIVYWAHASPQHGDSTHWHDWGARFESQTEAEYYLRDVSARFPKFDYRVEGHTYTEENDE
jgi:hypothetical protein